MEKRLTGKCPILLYLIGMPRPKTDSIHTPAFTLQWRQTMKGSAVIIVLAALFLLAQAIAAQLGFESISFGFYEELTKNTRQQCKIDAKKTLDGIKNMEKWALEGKFLPFFFFHIKFKFNNILICSWVHMGGKRCRAC